MRRLAALVAMALLAGCTTADDLAPMSSARTAETSSPTSDTIKTTVAVAYPRFDDNDPHDWRRTAPWSYAVHGTDVSKYQTSVAWGDAKAAGISFAFLKATEGGDRVDDNFSRELAARQGRRRAARRLSFLLFLPAGRGTGALVHPPRAARPFVAAAGARHGMESAVADLQAAGPTPTRCAARCACS